MIFLKKGARRREMSHRRSNWAGWPNTTIDPLGSNKTSFACKTLMWCRGEPPICIKCHNVWTGFITKYVATYIRSIDSISSIYSILSRHTRISFLSLATRQQNIIYSFHYTCIHTYMHMAGISDYQQTRALITNNLHPCQGVLVHQVFPLNLAPLQDPKGKMRLHNSWPDMALSL